MTEMIGLGLVGFGYWGPNLARNFSVQPNCTLVAICDINSQRAALARRQYPSVIVTQNYDDILENPDIRAILIAVPVSAHFDLARRALLAGKDVLVEKPLTATVAEAEQLISLADKQRRILAVDHTFLFTGAVQKIKEIIDSGQLGEILYVDSVRVNLGLFQPDVNVIFDLAPHDLSIMNYLIDKDPVSIQAMGISHAGNGIENVAYLHLDFPGGVIAHFHFNWLAPVKIRRTLIGGTKQMIVYDDMEPSEKVKIYDKGIVVKKGDIDSIYKTIIDYRTGDMVAPKLVHREALNSEAQHFLSCVENRAKPIADGMAGLRVVRLLEAAQASLRQGGAQIKMAPL